MPTPKNSIRGEKGLYEVAYRSPGVVREDKPVQRHNEKSQDALDNEEPSPTMKTVWAFDLRKSVCEKATKSRGKSREGEDECGTFATLLLFIAHADVNINAREHSRFKKANQQATAVEPADVLNECHAKSCQSPPSRTASEQISGPNDLEQNGSGCFNSNISSVE